MLRKIQPRHVTTVAVLVFILFVINVGIAYREDQQAKKAFCPRPPILSMNGSSVYVVPEVDVVHNPQQTNTLYLKDEKNNQRTLARFTGIRFSAPSWSPTGKFIVFVATYVGENTRSEIWRVNPDGTGLQSLVGFEDTFQNPNHPQVSPDGRYVILDAYSGIMELDVETLAVAWVVVSKTEQLDASDWYYFTNPTYIGTDGAISYTYSGAHESGFGYTDEKGENYNVTPWCK